MKKILLISFECPTGKTYCGGVGVTQYEALIKNRALRNNLSRRAKTIANKFLSKNRLRENLYRLLNSD